MDKRSNKDKPLALQSKATLRSHMETVHNLFSNDRIARTCEGCGKHFARLERWDDHFEKGFRRMSMCWSDGKTTPKEWDVLPPRTQQERADCWALPRDGEPSEGITIIRDGSPDIPEEGEEGDALVFVPPTTPVTTKRDNNVDVQGSRRTKRQRLSQPCEYQFSISPGCT